MPKPAINAESQLYDLKLTYRKMLPGKIAEIEHMFSILAANKSTAAYDELRIKIHNLIGSSGIFDLPDLSRKLRNFESVLLGIDISNTKKTKENIDKLWSHLISIKAMSQNPDSLEIKKASDNIGEKLDLDITPLRIVVASDDEQIQKKIQIDLAPYEHQLELVNNGEEAIQRFTELDIDLIIMEVLMPGLNGYHTAKALRKLMLNKYVPILFITSINREDELVKCIQSGGDDYLVKPHSPSALNMKIFSLDRMAKSTLKMCQ